jgi:anthranilate synthase/aminodeoxychorismate synthase-like glutamine amidotransferase
VVQVVRSDEVTVAAIAEARPAAIVMSPGPCTPNEAGVCLAVVQQLGHHIPMLGVCLGHQAICQAYGAVIVRSDPVHGRSTRVSHTAHPLFKGISSPFDAGRYHSLVAAEENFPADLQIIARAATPTAPCPGPIMAVAHRRHPVFGVQFHPESILTVGGYRLLANFLILAGLGCEADPAALAAGTAAAHAVN